MGNKPSAASNLIENDDFDLDITVHVSPEFCSNPQDSEQEVLGYLLPRSQIMESSALSEFSEVENLLAVYDWEDTPKYLFISHSYLGISHPDDFFNTKVRILRLVLQQMKQVEYIWLDFSCIPKQAEARSISVKNLHNIILNALRVIILPFEIFNTLVPPIYNLKGYSERAWCALEYSIILSRHPSKVRIAMISEEKRGASYRLQLHSVPTHDQTLGLHHLISGMAKLRTILEDDNKEEFSLEFQTSEPADIATIWELLKVEKQQIFEFAGMRRNSDFFVRTKYASTHNESKYQLYDEETLGKIGEAESCRMCGVVPLCW